MRTCDKCQKTFPNKNNLRQHRRNVHKIPGNLFPMECEVCHKMELSVALSDQHFRAKHGTQLEKICVYCGVGFDDAQKFFKHLLEKQGLPPPIHSIKEKTKKTNLIRFQWGSKSIQNYWIRRKRLAAVHD